jgi:serine/threonine protein kinase
MKCPECLTDNPPDSRFCRKCATPLPAREDYSVSVTKTLQLPVSELERGTTFAGRYEVIEELGKGGMGRVYKVFDRKIKEVVALKLIRPEISSDEKAIERFNTELRLARKISHRHVCRMYDLGEEGPSHFITMEYVPGEDLKRFIKRSGQLTVSKAVSIARQVCQGLEEAHRTGVIHRDLKPQNLMIDSEGNTRIMDFGIARFLEGDGMTTQGILIGTPDYMSPEQAELEDVDRRSDIYAVGVILFEMVTGRVPFEGKTPLSIAMKHKSQPPPDPREMNIQVPEELSRVILKCLEKDRERRYQSAEELLAALEDIAEGLPTTERIVPPVKSRTPKEKTATVKKRRSLIAAASFLVLVAAAVLIWQVLPGSHNRFSSQTVPEPPRPAVVFQPQKGEVPAGAKKENSSMASVQEEKQKAMTSKEEKEGETSPQGVIGQIVTSPDIRRFLPKDMERVLDPSKFSSGAQYLWRAFATLSPQAMKYLDKEDIEGIDNFLNSIQQQLPAEGSSKETIEQIKNKLKEGLKLQEEGKEEEAQKSYEETQGEMKKLLEVVREKEGADRARFSMGQARIHALTRNESARQNLLFKLATEKQKDADEAYDKGDFSGAETLYRIVEKIFTYSIQGGDEARCVEILQNYVTGIRADINVSGIPEGASWFYENGQEEERQADRLFKRKEYNEAADRYLQAAFLYEKVRENIPSRTRPIRRPR